MEAESRVVSKWKAVKPDVQISRGREILHGKCGGKRDQASDKQDRGGGKVRQMRRREVTPTSQEITDETSEEEHMIGERKGGPFQRCVRGTRQTNAMTTDP